MSEKKKKIIAILTVIIGVFLFVMMCYFHFSEKYRYDYRVGAFFSILAIIICLSYVMWEGYNLGKRMQARHKNDSDKD